MEAFIGQVQLFPYDFTPSGWAACEGQLLNISQSQALFAVVGAKFGGDGRFTYALPDLRGKEPLPGMRYFIAMSGIWLSQS